MSILAIITTIVVLVALTVGIYRYAMPKGLMHQEWYKYGAVILLLYAFIGGLLLPVPAKDILNESIRNLYYHVPMWFGMMLILYASMLMSIKYLNTSEPQYDIASAKLAQTGLIFGILGLVTGMLWAQYTWGEWWSNDPKQTGAATALLVYLAFFVLRGSIEDEDKRAKVSAVYSIFAFAALIPLLYIIPRMPGVQSLHPGSEGNPGFNTADLDGRMRMIFYPAILGWTFLGIWITSLYTRLEMLQWKKMWK